MIHKTELDYLADVAKKLLPVTNGCRNTMHEPDEQTVSAIVVGTHLDNACGDWLNITQLMNGTQEIVVILHREEPEYHLSFNLADLIALARIGANEIIKQSEHAVKESSAN